MASRSSSLSLLHSSPLLRRRSNTPTTVCCLSAPLCRRRLLSLASAASVLSLTLPSTAKDIPIFGLRKKLEKVEEAAEELIKEGEVVVEQAAEEIVKEGEVAVEKEIQVLGFGVAGDLIQAGAVAGAEAVGVLVGVSVINGILGPEAQGKKL